MGDEPWYSMYFAEFLGTYILVFTVGCNVIDGNAVWFVVSIAAVLIVITYALFPISKANFNPAVTLASALSGTIGWVDAAAYMLVQVVAGICAGYSYYGLYGKTFYLEPSPGYTWVAAFAAEGLYTFMYCFVFLNVACTRAHEGNQFYALAIGFVVVAGGYAVGGISGGCFNPAVAFGIDVPSAGTKMGWSVYYLLFEFCGAILAAGAFRLLRPATAINFVAAKEEPPSHESPAGIPRWAQQILAEFLGTYFLVLTVGFNVLGSSKAPAFSIAAALISMIYATGGDDSSSMDKARLRITTMQNVHRAQLTSVLHTEWLAHAEHTHVGGWHAEHGRNVSEPSLDGSTWRLEGTSEMGRNFTICFSGVAALAADRAEAAYRALRVPEAEARRTAHGALQRGRHLKCPAAQGGQLTEVIISRDVPGPPKSISGAHFNPAVTVAVMLTGRNKIDSGPMMGLAYMVTQNLAGLCAGLTYSTVMGAAFSLGPIEPFGWFAAAAAEILFTFLLCFVVLCVATVRTFNCGDMNGLAIGSCVIVGGFASGAISGGCMNPAISFGVDTSHSFKHGGWPYHWIFYNLMALGGAALAWGMFWLTRPNEFTKSGGVLLPSWAKAKGRQVGKAPFANPLVQKGFVPAGSPPPANPLVQKGFVPAPPSDHAGE